ncbi:MAG: thioredoxin family protein [Salibacteraceae bacterium]
MNKIELPIQQANKYYSYSQYKSMVADLFEQNLVTGPNQIESLLNSTKMSIQRMKKWDKIIKVSEGIKSNLELIEDNWTWYVITEGWCGDAAQIVPVLSKIAEQSEKLELKLLLRDENQDLMSNYLTNGGMAIPVLVAVNNITGEEMPHWGPRPEEIKKRLANFIQNNPNMSKSEISRELHLWYAKDKGISVQNDILELIQKHMVPAHQKLHKVG